MDYRINFRSKTVKGTIELPHSKSISNRLIIIRELSKGGFPINKLSESDDTIVMEQAFASQSKEVNIGHAGTSMRFLTAYYAATGQKKIMTGSDRMKNRPIGELVNSLNLLGADIKYVEKDGYPPIQTSGKALQGSRIQIRGSVSSQFITALLLVAPVLSDGLTIQIVDELISSSYVKLTLGLMQEFGIFYTWHENTIHIPHQDYTPRAYTVEADWSAASYWYQLALLADEQDILLCDLFENSFQGDAAVAEIFKPMGIETLFEGDKVRLKKTGEQPSFYSFDFINNPDVVQTMVVALCLKNIPFRLSGAQTLRIKETDRIAALQNEMAKLGYIIKETSAGVLEWDGAKTAPREVIEIETYHDHRMALAFAPAALYFPGIIIKDAMVVTKSYPSYWEDLKKVGLELHVTG